jgi:3-oxoacyl-[acyl-carrier protein] reductase
MGYRLENKVAIVTGAAKGIGLAICKKFTEEGAQIVAADLDLALAETAIDRIKGKGKKGFAHKVDVRDEEQVRKLFDEVRLRFGRIDILVNNAGVRVDKPIYKISTEEWDLVTGTQFRGAFNCSREAQKDMVQQKYGKIVNLSSPAPSALGARRQVAYASVSAAMEGFTKALAVELGPYNINVNCVAPDFIDTEMTRSLARGEGMYLDDLRRFVAALIPMRRMGTPEDVANVVTFMVSEEARFVSGQVIYVQGGP